MAFAAGEISKTANRIITALETLSEYDAEQIVEKNSNHCVHDILCGESLLVINFPTVP